MLGVVLGIVLEVAEVGSVGAEKVVTFPPGRVKRYPSVDLASVPLKTTTSGGIDGCPGGGDRKMVLVKTLAIVISSLEKFYFELCSAEEIVKKATITASEMKE